MNHLKMNQLMNQQKLVGLAIVSSEQDVFKSLSLDEFLSTGLPAKKNVKNN